MQWIEPEGHTEALEGLWRAARHGRLAHALLFEGPPGVGKFAAAVWFAAGLLCREGPGTPCGVCPACKKVRSGDWRGGHPDLLRIDPVEEGWEEIPVAAIAERRGGEAGGPAECLATFLMLKPREGNTRLVLVREAERLNVAAQNALLKTLEEPALGTVIVLESSRPAELLPTIRSRVVRLSLGMPPEATAGRLLAEAGIAGTEAEALLRLAEGSPGEALRLGRQGALRVLESLSELLERRLDPLEAAAEWLELPGDFGGGTALRQVRRRGCLVLDLALAEVAAARRACLALASPGEAGGSALAAALIARGELALGQISERLLRARRDLDLNLEPGGVLERAALDLAEPLVSPHVARR